MTKRNAPFVIVDSLPWDAPAGHAVFDRDGTGAVTRLQFGCPCGCCAHYGASFGPNKWSFDGNEQKPTVTPSLGCYPTGKKAAAVGPDGTYHWHGFLRNGVFEEC